MPTKDSSYLLVCETSQGRDSDLKSGIVSATFGDFTIYLHSQTVHNLKTWDDIHQALTSFSSISIFQW